MSPTDLYERRPSWQAAAACRGMDPAIFFPERGSNATKAKAVCEGCSVSTQCADAGMMDPHGVWGGMAYRDRQAHRQHIGITRRRSEAVPVCGEVSGHWAHRTAGEKPCDECVEWRRAYDAAAYAKRKGLAHPRAGLAGQVVGHVGDDPVAEIDVQPHHCDDYSLMTRGTKGAA